MLPTEWQCVAYIIRSPKFNSQHILFYHILTATNCVLSMVPSFLYCLGYMPIFFSTNNFQTSNIFHCSFLFQLKWRDESRLAAIALVASFPFPSNLWPLSNVAKSNPWLVGHSDEEVSCVYIAWVTEQTGHIPETFGAKFSYVVNMLSLLMYPLLPVFC